ncbi:hypothetical protein SBA4_830024 [Candidatus Sulfopaludibacter sp. SbA4]|nr:hypothetical protein SBA4_830024 [Candidatus Sulfopaludibacter sp. SbA4]
MRLQEAIHLVPRPDSKEPAGLGRGELTGTHSFERQGLKGSPRQTASVPGKAARHILGKFHRYLHQISLISLCPTGPTLGARSRAGRRNLCARRSARPTALLVVVAGASGPVEHRSARARARCVPRHRPLVFM